MGSGIILDAENGLLDLDHACVMCWEVNKNMRYSHPLIVGGMCPSCKVKFIMQQFYTTD